jgi:trehalose/maltose transport system permease protein
VSEATTSPAATATTSAAAAPKRRKRDSDRARAERRLGLMLVAPAAIVMIAVTGYPILYAVWLSLQRSDLRFPERSEFVGLGNYVTVLSSGLWWSDLGRTLLITVISVAIELVLGMLLALVMHRALVGRGLVRTASLIPYGIVTVVAAFAWRLAFSSADGGFVPALFNWTTDPLTKTAPTIAIAIGAEVWKTTPFMALLLLAGLSLVSDELHEAARVDGASAWQRFWRITVPLMRTPILVALMFRTLDAFRIFDSIYILSNTGQNRDVETVSILGYNELLNQLNLGLGSAISVLIFICVAIIAVFFIKGLGLQASQER